MAGDLERAVETLEAMFQRTESDLNSLTKKVEFEFEKDGFPEGENPAKLIQRVNDIKKEYNSLAKEVLIVQKTQGETMQFFKDQLTTLCQMTQMLHQQSGVEMPEKSDELKMIENMLGLKLFESQQVLKQTIVSEESSQVDCKCDHNVNSQPKLPVAEDQQDDDEFKISPATKRKHVIDFQEITQAEFEMVSSLVRGRVKLSDVNTTYKLLWQHFKKEKNSQLLTPKDMYKMGLKVSGATGEAKLKVLRSLKLLYMSSKGDVKLL